MFIQWIFYFYSIASVSFANIKNISEYSLKTNGMKKKSWENFCCKIKIWHQLQNSIWIGQEKGPPLISHIRQCIKNGLSITLIKSISVYYTSQHFFFAENEKNKIIVQYVWLSTKVYFIQVTITSKINCSIPLSSTHSQLYKK